MGTERQKKLAEKIIENSKKDKPDNKGVLLESVGYDKTTATKAPKRTFEQKGVKEELKARGFDEDSAKAVVKEILHNVEVKPDTRLRAAEQVFKVQGSYAAEKVKHEFDKDAPINIIIKKFDD